MRIVQITAEFSPIAKAGGLGEMVLGLCRELTRLGQRVEIILPKYDFLDLSPLKNVTLEVPDFKSKIYKNLYANAMWSAEYEGCSLHLLETRHPAGYLHRNKIYGHPDDIARFLYFSLAILEYLKLQNQPIDVLHLHDWHFALIAILARDHFHLPIKKIVLTIHSAEYQGKCAAWDFDRIGLSGVHYLTKLQDDNPNCPKTLNLLKGAILYSDLLTTVSPTYAKEVLTPKMGFYIDTVLRNTNKKLTGILNGIDQKFWDPAKDPYLLAHYDKDTSLQALLKAKQINREALQARFLLKNNLPWIGAITRLVTQKGPELLEEAIAEVIRLGGTFFLLGSSPDPKIQSHFEKLKIKYQGNPQALLYLSYDEGLAHLLYSALDFLIVPSHFEPCGLTQLIAMRYGTVPIAHATGGLKDTIIDCEDLSMPIKQRNGFLFTSATIPSMNAALKKAANIFHKDKPLFQSLIRHGMNLNSSWEVPAQAYLRLYKPEFRLQKAQHN